ncbi:MAG: hypothetical protein U0326_40150 [Polyangiales bacterium]
MTRALRSMFVWIAALAALAACSQTGNGILYDDGDASKPSADVAVRRDAGFDVPRFDVAPIDRPAVDVAPLDTYRPPERMTQRFACMDCPSTPFPESSEPVCSSDPAGRPELIYPPDGVLLPPNLNVLEFQFSPGTGNTLWEIDFINAVTDIRVTTRCSAITSVRGRATGACAFGIPQNVWDALVLLNRGREPVTVTVRGTNGTACATSASRTRRIQFSFEDIEGGIYYWQSAVFGGTAGRTGGIYLHDFGARDRVDTAFLESGTSGRCTGCHNLSRDGERVSVGVDDPDADDEFADVRTQLMRVRDRTMVAAATIPPGFQTFTHDHAFMLGSTFTYAGTGNRTFTLYNGETGARVRDIMLPGTMVGTQPDWSADDRHVVFVAPRAGSIARQGDHHFHGGDLYAMDVDAAQNFSTPRLLLPANLRREIPMPDAGNYYPSYSPDGQFIVFNHAESGDIFYNRGAQVWLASADGGAISALSRLNGGEGLTNSWPRWSPYVQSYGMGHILWVTFSSNRNYGVRVENDGLPNCYPPASPTENTPQSTAWATCQQPQIWMAAVGVDVDEFGRGRDTSWPAFWLPFQNVTSHNHSAQWVARVVTRTCVMETGTCPGPGGTDCCSGFTCDAATHRCVRPCVAEHGVCPGPGGAMCCNGIPCDAVTNRCERPPG